ncbi:uncharacterized protein JCM15063_006467 [Sporobolomyces koalae]|uniref:uncharacterized protein n=1 Tax=Sporobolomyces koalae TaxID=500713 RepID=UPI0031781703
MQSSESVHLSIAHSGRSVNVSYECATPTSRFLDSLEDEFSVLASTAKLLSKGKRLDCTLGETLASMLRENGFDPLQTTVDKPLKLMLIGPKSQDLQALRNNEAIRERKREAFQHHQAKASVAKPTPAARIRNIGTDDDPDRFKFYQLEPFPNSVPMYDKRMAMLERLSTDEAVLDCMRRHKFAVGILTELHPILQPTLLGLNTNAGQKVSLRLLTNDLEGTRSYNEVRRVLLHELSHNRFSDHDDDFKALNSQLNREVAAFESSPYFEPWTPAASYGGDSQRSHRLNEDEAERVWEKLQFGPEEEVELRRDRVGAAAEARLRREQEAAKATSKRV